MKEPGDQSIQVLKRAFRLLECFGTNQPELGFTDLCRMLDLPKGTVHRLLATLQQEGYVAYDSYSQKYHLSVKVLNLAHAAVCRLRLEQVADAFLRQLAAQSGGDAHIAVLDKAEGTVTYLETVSPVLPLTTAGLRGPVHCSALGKALAAYEPEGLLDRILANRGMPRFTPRTLTDPDAFKRHLELVRRCGCAVDHEELKPGWSCVAAPVQDHTGHVIAAISVSGPSYHFTQERLETLATQVGDAANDISRTLGCGDERLIRTSAGSPALALMLNVEEVMLPEQPR